MTPVWFCETHEELGGNYQCWIGMQHPEAVICEMVSRLLVDPESALVLVRDADGNWPDIPDRVPVRWGDSHTTRLSAYEIRVALDALAEVDLYDRAEAAKENPHDPV